MQHMRRAMSAYGQAAETLAPARQVVLLYDGAIRRIKEARDAIGRRAIKERYVAIAKAAAIIDALQACLDHERGGEIARNLDQLYTYFGLRLQRINLRDDVQVCDELVERLGELRASWAQIADVGAAPGAAGPAAPPAGPRSVEAGTTVTI
jgi:flagellar secretion chaperone FliS